MNLKERGFGRTNVRVIIHDGVGGLKQATSLLFSQVPQQLCTVHKTRNIKKKDLLGPSCQKAMQKQAQEIFQAPSKKEAIQRVEQFQAQWENKEPKATKNFLKDMDLCLRFYDYPKHLWSYLKSTDPLERLLGESRRRIRLYDSFSHEKSCELII